MDRSPYSAMTPSGEAPNPLRPYYRPPSIGFPEAATTTSTRAGNSTSSPFSLGGLLPDISYDGILGEQGNGPSTLATMRALTDQMMWKYSSVLMAQPFEIAKMVLQVRCGGDLDATRSHLARRGKHRTGQGYRSDRRAGRVEPVGRIVLESSDEEEEEEENEMSYFTSNKPPTGPDASEPILDTSDSQAEDPRSERSDRGRRRGSSAVSPRMRDGKLVLVRPDSLMDVLAQLWTREGAWGTWKGTNVTFLHSVLLKTVETWSRGVLSAMLNVPDPGIIVSAGGLGGLDILDSPSPLSSLGVAVTSAAIAGLLLAPLDAVRTRIMLTTTARAPRSIMGCFKVLPSWHASPSLLVPALLHSVVPVAISTSTPLFLRSHLRLDPVISSSSYNICIFLSSVIELFIKLPFETVLRRAQMDFVSRPAAARASSTTRSSRHRRRLSAEPDAHVVDTVVNVGPYTGVIATMWRITREEGSTLQRTAVGAQTSSQTVVVPRSGQGVQGLWRGWRVGFWALVGVWGTAALGTGKAGGSEF